MHPFDQGFAACESGALISENPYVFNSQEFLDWELGYKTAYECPF